MPSDSKKKRNAKKVESAKMNGASNGAAVNGSKSTSSDVELTAEGTRYLLSYIQNPSRIEKSLYFSVEIILINYYVFFFQQLLSYPLSLLETLCKKLEEDARIAAEARAVTGVLG